MLRLLLAVVVMLLSSVAAWAQAPSEEDIRDAYIRSLQADKEFLGIYGRKMEWLIKEAQRQAAENLANPRATAEWWAAYAAGVGK